MNREWKENRMASAVAAALLLGTIIVSLAGCSASKAANTCVPGASPTCGCPDGRTGAQVCTSAGTFGPCVCAGADAGTDGSPAPAGTDASIFTPPTDTTHMGPGIPLMIDSLPTSTQISSNETDYVVHVTLANSVTAATQFEIAYCLASVLYNGRAIGPDADLRLLDGAFACRPGTTQVDLGTFVVGTTEQSGTIAFTVSMFDTIDTLIVQGSTIPTAVQPGSVLHLELVAAQVAH